MKDSNQIQQHFSSEKQPTLWRALPALEELQSTWEKKRDSPTFNLYKDALSDGLEKLKKYYFRLDEKPSFVLALGKFQHIYSTHFIIYLLYSVLHPYYKLDYIKVSWGGPAEKAADIAAGNPHAKDWQAEAKEVVEKTVCFFLITVTIWN